jgi:sedoheptulokinase
LVTDGGRRPFLGIDVGTTSLSVALVDAEQGVIDTSSRPHNAELPPDGPGAHILDPGTILELVLSELSRTEDEYGEPAAIGLTGQMHGILYADQDGEAVSPLYTWLDGRLGWKHNERRSYAELMREELGQTVPTGFGAATHFVHQKRGTLADRAEYLCGIVDYVGLKLAGLSAPVTSPSLAHSVGFFDLPSADSDRTLWDLIGRSSSMLPEVREPDGFIGMYKGRTPVLVPVGDNQAGIIGALTEPENSVLISVGTSGQITGVFSDPSDLPSPVEEPLEVRPFVDGGRLLVGASLTGGKALQALADFVGEIAARAGGNENYDPYEIFASAEKLSASEEVEMVVRTTLAGTRADSSRRGSIKNITLDNLRIKNLARGFCEGVIDELLSMWPLEFPPVCVASGNALRRLPLLREVLAERVGTEPLLTKHTEESAVGAALLAVSRKQGVPVFEIARTLM